MNRPSSHACKCATETGLFCSIAPGNHDMPFHLHFLFPITPMNCSVVKFFVVNSLWIQRRLSKKTFYRTQHMSCRKHSWPHLYEPLGTRLHDAAKMQRFPFSHWAFFICSWPRKQSRNTPFTNPGDFPPSVCFDILQLHLQQAE